MDWGSIIIAAIGAVGLDRLIVYLFEMQARRRKAEAEADAAEAEATNRTLDGAFQLIDVLTKQLAAQEKDIEVMKGRLDRIERLHKAALQRIEYLMAGIKRLIGQIRDLGHEPVWTPDEVEPPGEETP